MYIDLSNVDWELLRDQKSKLLDEIPNMADTETIDATFGIINLVDHIQEEASEVLGDAVIFGETV